MLEQFTYIAEHHGVLWSIAVTTGPVLKHSGFAYPQKGVHSYLREKKCKTTSTNIISLRGVGLLTTKRKNNEGF
jgi:hypothetical protein